MIVGVVVSCLLCSTLLWERLWAVVAVAMMGLCQESSDPYEDAQGLSCAVHFLSNLALRNKMCIRAHHAADKIGRDGDDSGADLDDLDDG